MYYAPTIFKDAGMQSSTAAIWASVTVSIVTMTSRFIAIRYVDRTGRRPLLVIGLIGMTAALLALAAVFALGTMAGWGGNLLVSLTFLSLIDALGDGGTFLLYALVSVASIVFVLRLVPETRGRTLEQIEAELVS